MNQSGLAAIIGMVPNILPVIHKGAVLHFKTLGIAGHDAYRFGLTEMGSTKFRAPSSNLPFPPRSWTTRTGPLERAFRAGVTRFPDIDSVSIIPTARFVRVRRAKGGGAGSGDCGLVAK